MTGVTQRIKTLSIAGLVLLFILTILLRSTSLINHDVSWYLYATEKWRSGAVLYHDIIEVNPPLAFWLTLPALWIGDLAGISAKAGLVVWLSALSAVTLMLCMANFRGMRSPGITWKWPLLFGFGFALLVMPGADFGQREHYFVIFLLPYLVLAMRRLEGVETARYLAVGTGLWAAAGLCLKPHFFLVPLAVELVYAIRERRIGQIFRGENLAIGSAAALFAALVWYLHPEFITRILPLGVAAYMPFYGLGAVVVLRSSVIVCGAIGILIYLTIRHRIGSMSLVFLVAGVATLAIFYAQMKGFRYQLLPALILGFLAAVSRLSEGKRVFNAEVLVVLLLLIQPVRSFFYDYLAAEIVKEVRATGERSIFIATTYVSISFPMVTELDYSWSSRFPAQWLLPYAAAMQDRKNKGGTIGDFAESTIAYARKSTVDDLVKQPPGLIVIDERKSKPYFTVPFDYVAFYRGDERFSDFWSQYELDHSFGGWTFYRRKNEGFLSARGSQEQ